MASGFSAMTTKTNGGGSPPAGARPTEKQQRLAAGYDAEGLPIYARRFGQMALRALALPETAQPTEVLEIGCATGDLTLEIARRLPAGGRVTALEASSPLAARAEAKRAA